MFKILNAIFYKNKDCSKYDKQDNRKYECLAKLDINIYKIKMSKIRINSIYPNVYKYLNALDILTTHDYLTYITPNMVSHTVSYKNILLRDWLIDTDGSVSNDLNNEFKKFKDQLVKLQLIRDNIKDKDDNESIFNSNVIGKYIINMRDIIIRLHCPN
jgi:hypothetical protein